MIDPKYVQHQLGYVLLVILVGLLYVIVSAAIAEYLDENIRWCNFNVIFTFLLLFGVALTSFLLLTL